MRLACKAMQLKSNIPESHAMSKRIKMVIIGVLSLVALLVITFVLQPDIITFFISQADSIQRAGNWEDDPKNWYRAFNEEQPREVKVVHSKYWRINKTNGHVYFYDMQL